MPSVLGSLKKLSNENTAKRALSFASSEAGGVTSAPCAAALPRGRQQVNDLRRHVSKSPDDAVYSLMLMCKEGEGSKSSDAFVRIVNAAPYPMMILAFDWTLDDLVQNYEDDQDNQDNPLCELNLPAHLASTVWSRANSLVNDCNSSWR